MWSATEEVPCGRTCAQNARKSWGKVLIMTDVLAIEARRQVEQSRLDALKDAKERNRLGQFATPPNLSLEIARYAWSQWGRRGPVRFLDPAIGSGSFYGALLRVFSRDAIQSAQGIELDPAFVRAAATLWGGMGLQVTEADFTVLTPQARFNLILTNPPYVRHHHLSTGNKERLQTLTRRVVGFRPSGLSGLYCYFLFLTHAWMTDDALAVWLIPSEFMDVNYGSAVKRYLTERVTLLRIHRFDPNTVQFDDALVTSAIVAFRNTPPCPSDVAAFTFGGNWSLPAVSEVVPIVELRRIRKWTLLPHARVLTGEPTIRLGDLFTIKRGLASGANSFFIMPRQQAMQHGIPQEALKPILPSPRYLRTNVVESEADGWPMLSEPPGLIDCSIPEEKLRLKYPAFWAYLESGRARGINRGYLTSRRTPWYSQEQRPAAPFLCTYMGRQRDKAKPFRFIWNKSQATAANVYLLLYPRPILARALAKGTHVAEAVFKALNQLSIHELISNGRVYGGGLHKLEPSELANLSAVSVAQAAGIEMNLNSDSYAVEQLEFAF